MSAELSGRVTTIENQVTFIAQDLLQRIDLIAAGNQTNIWNQQFDLVDTNISTMKSQLQTLQSLYTNLYIRLQSSLNNINASATGVMHYGSFYSTGNYLNASATGVNVFTITNTNIASGVSVVDNSKITLSRSGIYDIQFSAQFSKSDAGDDQVDIWLSKNGQMSSWTNSRIVLHGNGGKALPSWNFVESANSGDYFELYWHSADMTTELYSEQNITSPDRPEIPCIILTVTQVR